MLEDIETSIQKLCGEYVSEYEKWSKNNKGYKTNKSKIIEKWGIEAGNSENILSELKRKKDEKKAAAEERLWRENTDEEIQKKAERLSRTLASFVVLLLLTIVINVTNLLQPLALSTSFRIGIWMLFFTMAVVLTCLIYIVTEKILADFFIPLWKYRGKRIRVKCSKVAAIIAAIIILLIGLFYIAINWGLWGNNSPIEGSSLEKWSEFGFCLLVGIIISVVAYFVCYKKSICFEKIRELLVKDDEKEEKIKSLIMQELDKIEKDYESDKEKLKNAGGGTAKELHEKLRKIMGQVTGKLTPEQMDAELSDKLYLAEWAKIAEGYKEPSNVKEEPYEVTGVDWKKGPVVFLYTWENHGAESEVLDRLLPAVCQSCNLFNSISLCEASYIDYQSACRIAHTIFEKLKVKNRKEDETDFRAELTKHKKEIREKLKEKQGSYIDQYNMEQLYGAKHYLKNKMIHLIIPDASTANNFSLEADWWDVFTDCAAYGIFPFFYVEKRIWEEQSTSFIREFRSKFIPEGYSVYEVKLIDDNLTVKDNK